MKTRAISDINPVQSTCRRVIFPKEFGAMDRLWESFPDYQFHHNEQLLKLIIFRKFSNVIWDVSRLSRLTVIYSVKINVVF